MVELKSVRNLQFARKLQKKFPEYYTNLALRISVIYTHIFLNIFFHKSCQIRLCFKDILQVCLLISSHNIFTILSIFSDVISVLSLFPDLLPEKFTAHHSPNARDLAENEKKRAMLALSVYLAEVSGKLYVLLFYRS